MLKPILPNIWQWSWFSEEKQLDFNGHLLTVGEHRILVDPPPLTSEEKMQIKRMGAVDYIVLTNRDHVREAAVLHREWRCHLYVPELDAAEMDGVTPTRTYKDGELLPGGLWAVNLKDQKSPGECALYLQQGKGVLIVGDALIGKPPGAVCLLPAEKYADLEGAREGLRRLLKYQFESLLVGDGTAILSNAKGAVSQLLDS